MSNMDFFQHSRASISKEHSKIWPNFEPVLDFMPVLLTCKFHKDLIKNKEAIPVPDNVKNLRQSNFPLGMHKRVNLTFLIEMSRSTYGKIIFCMNLVVNKYSKYLLYNKFQCHQPFRYEDEFTITWVAVNFFPAPMTIHINFCSPDPQWLHLKWRYLNMSMDDRSQRLFILQTHLRLQWCSLFSAWLLNAVMAKICFLSSDSHNDINTFD